MQWKPDVTVAAIIQREDKFLLVEENADDCIVFNQPAGHLEENESLTEAVVREVLEETAGHFLPKSLVGVYHHLAANGLTYIRFCFYGDCDNFEPNRPLDDGILRTVWLNSEEILLRKNAMRSPLVIKCIEDFQSGQSFPLGIIDNLLANNN